MNSNPNDPRPPLSQFILTTAELSRLDPDKFTRRKGAQRRPVWRHWYDPYAGAPVAQTVEVGLANAAKARPGTIPEVEMLTPEEVEERREASRNRPASAPSPRKAARGKR